MAPTRGGRDVERGATVFSPGVVYDAAGNPVGFNEGSDADVVPTRPGRPGRSGRRPNIISRALRGLGNRLLGNG